MGRAVRDPSQLDKQRSNKTYLEAPQCLIIYGGGVKSAKRLHKKLTVTKQTVLFTYVSNLGRVEKPYSAT